MYKSFRSYFFVSLIDTPAVVGDELSRFDKVYDQAQDKVPYVTQGFIGRGWK